MTALNPIFILVAAFLAVYAQTSFDTFRNLVGAQFDLLPVLVVYAALTYPIEFVALLAVCSGFWLDSMSANPLGVSVLPLFFVGIVIYRLRGLFLRELAYAQFILGLLASAVVPVFVLISLLSLDKKPLFGWGSIWQWVVVTAFGAAIAPAVFFVFDRLHHALSYPVAPEPSFRPDREIKRGRH